MARRWRLSRIILLLVLIGQTVTHLFWLSISAHSGQVAIPWMMNRGMVLFDTVLEQHAPGSSLLAAFLQRILPLEPVTITQLANLVLVLIVTILVYVLATRLTGNEGAGIAAALFWAWFEPVYGNVLLYFDSILGLLALIAVLVWLWTEKRGFLAPLLVGLILGLATLAKQHAFGAAIFVGIWLLVMPREHKWRDVLIFAVSVMVIPLAVILFAATNDILDGYLYWNWQFNLSGIMDSVPLDGNFVRKVLLTNVLAPAFMLLVWRGDNIRHRHIGVLAILLYLATSATIYPRPGEVHVMGQLPLLSVMSGIVLWTAYSQSRMQSPLKWLRTAPLSEALLAGVLVALAAAWAWTGIAPYGSAPAGRGAVLAHDELIPVADRLITLRQPGDTLFILPETDSTPQLHPMTDMLPSGMWIKGWHWYFEAEGVMDRLTTEWETHPPTYVVIFPDLISVGEPGIHTLLNIVYARYEHIATVESIPLHGDAEIWRLMQ